MGRAPCCDKANVKKGPWTPEEDAKLKEFIEKYGTGGNWIALPQKAGLRRCGKSCRLRWLNYLRPNIKHGEFSDDEDKIICSLYARIGSRWSVIAAQLPGRTDNDIKNYWNTKLKKQQLLTMPPSLKQKQTLFPSISFQQPPYDHQTSHQFLNNSSSIYNLTPNLMTVDNTFNSHFVHDDHNNVTDLQSYTPSPPPTNSLMSNNSVDVNDNCFNYLGFDQDDQYYSMCNSQMPMFGSTYCFFEGGNYNKDYQTTLDDQVVGDQVQNQSFMIKNHVTPLMHNYNLEEVKELKFNSYLFHEGSENYQNGMCSYNY